MLVVFRCIHREKKNLGFACNQIGLSQQKKNVALESDWIGFSHFGTQIDL